MPEPTTQHDASDVLLKAASYVVVTWNDTPGRTADEVAEALRQAASA